MGGPGGTRGGGFSSPPHVIPSHGERLNAPASWGYCPEGRKGREMGDVSWLDVDRKMVEIALKRMEEYRSKEDQDSFLRIAIAAGMRVARGEQ